MKQGRLQVEATPYGDTKAEIGNLTFVDNTVDNTTGTIKLKATFDNSDNRLWPGQFSTVLLRLAQDENATVVPSQTVQNGQNGDFVYVVKSDSTVEQRTVKVARTVGGDIRNLQRNPAGRNGGHRRPAAADPGHQGASHQRAVGASWKRASMNICRTIYSPPDHDDAGDGGDPAFRDPGLSLARGERSAERGLPDD